MSNKSPVGQFYFQLFQFKDKMITILEQLNRTAEIRAINKNFDKLIMLKKVNPKLAVEYFYNEGVVYYVDQIATMDTHFFINSTTALDKATASQYGIDDNHLFLIKEVGVIWEHLNTDTQQNIWKYIKVICLLAEKALNKSALQNKLRSLSK